MTTLPKTLQYTHPHLEFFTQYDECLCMLVTLVRVALKQVVNDCFDCALNVQHTVCRGGG